MAWQSKIERIVIHCSDSPHRGDSAISVQKWHEENGWAGIGYHYTIDEFGELENGRPEYWVGAHVRGFNQNSLGVMLFGIRHFTAAQMDSLHKLLIELKYRHPNAEICGHYELDPNKSCPNFNVKQWCRENHL